MPSMLSRADLTVVEHAVDRPISLEEFLQVRHGRIEGGVELLLIQFKFPVLFANSVRPPRLR